MFFFVVCYLMHACYAMFFFVVCYLTLQEYLQPALMNQFLICSDEERALLSADCRVLESFHCGSAFAIMREDCNNVLSTLSFQVQQDIRQGIITLVLASNIASPSQLLSAFSQTIIRSIASESPQCPVLPSPHLASLRVRRLQMQQQCPSGAARARALGPASPSHGAERPSLQSHLNLNVNASIDDRESSKEKAAPHKRVSRLFASQHWPGKETNTPSSTAEPPTPKKHRWLSAPAAALRGKGDDVDDEDEELEEGGVADDHVHVGSSLDLDTLATVKATARALAERSNSIQLIDPHLKLEVSTPAEQDVLLRMIMKVAGLSYAARAPVLTDRWCDNLSEEFFKQGEDERRAGLPVSRFFDSQVVADRARFHVSYLRSSVKPFVDVMGCVSSAIRRVCCANVKANIEVWEAALTGASSSSARAGECKESHDATTTTCSNAALNGNGNARETTHYESHTVEGDAAYRIQMGPVDSKLHSLDRDSVVPLPGCPLPH